MRTRRSALELFWQFVAERHHVWHRRHVERLAPPWTDDPWLRVGHFTNVYRELDPGTQWLVERMKGFRHRYALERLLNLAVYRMGLHEASAQHVGWLTLQPEAVRMQLRNRLDFWREYHGSPWTPAYMVSNYGDGRPKAEVFADRARWLAARLVQDQMEWATTAELDRRQSLVYLMSLPGMGRFLAFQVLVDCCYEGIGLLGWSNDGWAVCGPGARRGLLRIMSSVKPSEENNALGWLCSIQAEPLDSWDMPFWLNGDMRSGLLSRANMQNCLCEYDKYVRAREGGGGRVRRFDDEAAHQRQGATV